MKFLYFSLAFFTTALFASCDFSPSGNHFEDINPQPDIRNVTIDLNESTDTLLARGYANYQFSISLPDRSFYGYQVTLDGKKISEGYSYTGSFQIDGTALNDGNHTLTLSVRSGSKTGSLADQAGVEVVEIYRKWVVVVDKAPPTPVKLIKVAAGDGTLKLEWEKYPRRNIKNFIIYRYFPAYKRFLYRAAVPPSVTSWTDNHYLGGETAYMVAVEDHDHRRANSDSAYFNAPHPSLLKYEYVNGNDLVITFSSSKFPGNFGKYTLQEYGFNGFNNMSYETAVLTDTVVTFRDVGIGGDLAFSLTTYSKSSSGQPETVNSLLRVEGHGKEHSFGPFSISAYAPSTDLFYDFSGEEIRTMDATTLQVKEVRKFSAGNLRTLSADGKYLYNLDEQGLHQLDPVSLQTIRSYSLSDFIGNTYYGKKQIEVSNDHKLTIHGHSYWSPDSVFVVDMSTQQVELRYQHLFHGALSRISPDGQMVVSTNTIFRRREDGSWEHTYLPNLEINSVFFHPTEPLYAFKSKNGLTFFSTTSGQAVRSLTIAPGSVLTGVDPTTGYLATTDFRYFYLYNPENGQELKKVKVVNNAMFAFFKSKLFSNSFYLPLSF